MNYQIRQAQEADLPAILHIYANARKFMADRGNAGQWGTNRPSVEQTKTDILDGNLYVLTNQETVHGVFAMIPGDDPTYHKVYNGTWHHNLPYVAIHRVAGDGSGGIFDALIRYALMHYSYIRIDTHENNIPMRRAIGRAGFLYCGTILTDDGTPRLAFDLKK